MMEEVLVGGLRSLVFDHAGYAKMWMVHLLMSLPEEGIGHRAFYDELAVANSTKDVFAIGARLISESNPLEVAAPALHCAAST